jgi:LysM repeat protein/multisubunit Na+/H+ antiporter MnhC subunit
VAERIDRNHLLYLFFFAVGLLGTTVFVVLARRMLRCVLAYGLMDPAAILLVALLFGVGVGLAAFLPAEGKRVVSSLYFGAALVLVGFILVAWLAPGPPEEACLAFFPGASAPRAMPTRAVPPSPESGRFLSPLGTPSLTVVPTPAAHPTCGPPYFWVQYTVCPGDTLYSLASWFGIATYELRLANCLASDAIYAGQVLWVPPHPPVPVCHPESAVTAVPAIESPSPTAVSLPGSVLPTPGPHPTGAPPYYWVPYTVCPGDTVYSLAAWFEISVSELKTANGLVNDTIYVGQVLLVPPYPPAPACQPMPVATAVSPTATPGP